MMGQKKIFFQALSKLNPQASAMPKYTKGFESFNADLSYFDKSFKQFSLV